MLNVIQQIGKFKAICKCTNCNSEYTTNIYDAKKSRMGHLCKVCKNPTGQKINQKLLHKYFIYNIETGIVTCKLPQHKHQINGVIGYMGNTGYLLTGLGKNTYLLHRLIWLYMTNHMPEQVDHINHNKLDNRWTNLREVSNTDNSKNCSVSKNSVTKINGVSVIATSGKYRAYITVNKKQIHLGVFVNKEAAIRARAKADKYYNFHVNHGS